MKKLFSPHNHTIEKWLLYLLAFSLPFERIPSVDVAGVTVRPSLLLGGLLILRAAQVAVASADHGGQAPQPHPRAAPSLTRSDKLLLAFAAWLVLLVPFSFNTTRAAQVVAFTLFVIMLALAIKTLLKREFIDGIIKSVLASTVVVCLFGVYQYLGNLAGLSEHLTGLRDRYSWQLFGFPRIESTALEPLYFAAFLMLPLSIMLAYSVKKGLRKLQLFILAFGSICLFITASRGGTLAYIAIILSLVGYVIMRQQWRRLAICLLVVALSYGASLVIIGNFNKPGGATITQKTGVQSYKEQIKTTGLEGGGDERAKSRTRALEIFLQHPLTGVGPGNFGPVTQNNVKGDGWTIVNNETLELLAETGAVGLGLLAAFLLAMLISAAKFILSGVSHIADSTLSTVALGLILFVIGMAVQYQTFSTLYVVHIWFGVGLLLGVNKLVAEAEATTEKAAEKISSGNRPTEKASQ